MKDRRWVVQKEKKKKDGLVKTSASSSSNEVSVTHGFLSGREDSCLGSHAWEVADLYSWHYLNRNQISGVITSFIYPFLLRLIPASLPLHPSMSDVFWPSLTLFSLLLLERWRTSFLTPTLKLVQIPNTVMACFAIFSAGSQMCDGNFSVTLPTHRYYNVN